MKLKILIIAIFFLSFLSSPVSAQECGDPEFKYNQCVACNLSEPVYQDSCGNYTTGGRQNDSTCASWCSNTEPNPPQPPDQPANGGDQCSGQERNYNQCVACNISQSVHQDACGNYSVGENQFDSACASWCTPETPPPANEPAPPACQETKREYEQCGGTIGLERFDPTHVYIITEVKDCQGNLSYPQELIRDAGVSNTCTSQAPQSTPIPTLKPFPSPPPGTIPFDPVPSCSQTSTYCESGSLIYMYGGGYDFTQNQCAYRYANLGSCQDTTAAPPSTPSQNLHCATTSNYLCPVGYTCNNDANNPAERGDGCTPSITVRNQPPIITNFKCELINRDLNRYRCQAQAMDPDKNNSFPNIPDSWSSISKWSLLYGWGFSPLDQVVSTKKPVNLASKNSLLSKVLGVQYSGDTVSFEITLPPGTNAITLAVIDGAGEYSEPVVARVYGDPVFEQSYNGLNVDMWLSNLNYTVPISPQEITNMAENLPAPNEYGEKVAYDCLNNGLNPVFCLAAWLTENGGNNTGAPAFGMISYPHDFHTQLSRFIERYKPGNTGEPNNPIAVCKEPINGTTEQYLYCHCGEPAPGQPLCGINRAGHDNSNYIRNYARNYNRMLCAASMGKNTDLNYSTGKCSGSKYPLKELN